MCVPVFGGKQMTALYKIVQDDHPPMPDGVSQALRDFLLQCFKKQAQVTWSRRGAFERKSCQDVVYEYYGLNCEHDLDIVLHRASTKLFLGRYSCTHCEVTRQSESTR